ncbi:MAG: GGDEF domain-containing protein [Solirubrobacteraceae bacterium]
MSSPSQTTAPPRAHHGHVGLRGAPMSRWMWPFVLVALAVQASDTDISGARSAGDFAASCAVLGALVLVVGALAKLELQRAAWLLAPLGYLVSLLLLFASQRSSAAGLRSMVLLPIVWSALYQRAWEAALVTCAAAAVLGGASVIAGETLAVTIRLVVLWTAMGALVVVSVQNLRRWLGVASAEREYALRRAEMLGTVAEDLNSTLDPRQVISTALHLIGGLSAGDGGALRQVRYLTTDEGDAVAIEAARSDEATSSGPLAPHEHEILADARRTHAVRRGALAVTGAGTREDGASALDTGAEGSRVQDSGNRYGAWIPIEVDGDVHGVLAIETAGGPMAPGEVSLMNTIGQILELSLANAIAHERVARASMTDPLTSLANRRGLESLFEERRGRRAIGILSIDVDNLKATNDSEGHGAGDELISAMARAIEAVLRGGDIAARMGGDEFAVVIFDAGPQASLAAAGRIMATLEGIPEGSPHPRASVGVACGSPSDSLENTLRRADEAMYVAKRAGGMRVQGEPERAAQAA